MVDSLLGVVKDYSSGINTLVLLAGLWFIKELRADVRQIKDNHLPHLDRRLAKIEGRFAQMDTED